MGSSSQETNFTLAAYAATKLPIHEYETYGTSANSYGRIQVSGQRANSLIAELVRIRYQSNNIDFSMPTDVRP